MYKVNKTLYLIIDDSTHFLCFTTFRRKRRQELTDRLGKPWKAWLSKISGFASNMTSLDKLEVPKDLFKDVKYYIVGSLDKKVTAHPLNVNINLCKIFECGTVTH